MVNLDGAEKRNTKIKTYGVTVLQAVDILPSDMEFHFFCDIVTETAFTLCVNQQTLPRHVQAAALHGLYCLTKSPHANHHDLHHLY